MAVIGPVEGHEKSGPLKPPQPAVHARLRAQGRTGLVPFLFDRGRSAHPSAVLPEVLLISLDVTSPQPHPVETALKALGVNHLAKTLHPLSLSATVLTRSELVDLPQSRRGRMGTEPGAAAAAGRLECAPPERERPGPDGEHRDRADHDVRRCSCS